MGVPIVTCKVSLFFLTPAEMAHLHGNSVMFFNSFHCTVVYGSQGGKRLPYKRVGQ